MRIFKKAGTQPWAAWVPVYNNWKLLEIGGQHGFWAILSFIPIVNIVAAVYVIIAMYNIGLKLGKGGAFVVLALFLPIVWLIWLAVDGSTWNDAAGQPRVDTDTAPTAAAAPAPTVAPAQPFAAPQPATDAPSPFAPPAYTPPAAPQPSEAQPAADQSQNTNTPPTVPPIV